MPTKLEIDTKAKQLKYEMNKRYRQANSEKWNGYYRDYYTTHKEQIKKNQQKYWERRALKELSNSQELIFKKTNGGKKNENRG